MLCQASRFAREFKAASPDTCVQGALMRVPGMGINGSAGTVLEGHLHLMRTTPHNDISRKQRAIVLNDGRILVAIFDVHRDPIKVLSVLLKDIGFGGFLSHSIYWQHDLIRPFRDRNLQLQPLPREVRPLNELVLR